MADGITLIGLVNPKNPSNVGSVLRAAGCFNADKILYSGERYARAQAFQTDTKHHARRIPLEAVTDFRAVLPAGAKLVGVELTEGATPLPAFTHPSSAMYLFGPEDGSLSQAHVDQCDEIIYIPCRTCLNLAATVNVVLYDRLAKQTNTDWNDEVIRQSRDTNNRTRFTPAANSAVSVSTSQT